MLIRREVVTQQEGQLHLCSIWFFFGVHHLLFGLVSSQVLEAPWSITEYDNKTASDFPHISPEQEKCLLKEAVFEKGISFSLPQKRWDSSLPCLQALKIPCLLLSMGFRKAAFSCS